MQGLLAYAEFEVIRARRSQERRQGWRQSATGQVRFPLLGAYDLCLKCSHLFNILDARGAISVTERVGVIARVRALAVGIAKAWVDQQSGQAIGTCEKKRNQLRRRNRSKEKEALSPVSS